MSAPKKGRPRPSVIGAIEVRNITGVSKSLKTMMPKKFNDALYAGIQAATIHLSGKIKLLLEGPVLNRQSGNLFRSIQPETFRRSGTVIGIVGTHMEYAPVHEFGATIRPKSADGMLAFKIGDDLILTKEVKIPRRPFFARAFEEENRTVSNIIRDEVHKRAVAAFNGEGSGRSIVGASARVGISPRGFSGVGVG